MQVLRAKETRHRRSAAESEAKKAPRRSEGHCNSFLFQAAAFSVVLPFLKKKFDQIVSKFEQVRQNRYKSLQVGTRRHKTQQEGQEVTRRDKFIGFGSERGRMAFWLVLGAADKINKIVEKDRNAQDGLKRARRGQKGWKCSKPVSSPRRKRYTPGFAS